MTRGPWMSGSKIWGQVKEIRALEDLNPVIPKAVPLKCPRSYETVGSSLIG
jgi:hypothetical protein